MDLFEALYTTRAMRRLKTDPIPEDVVMRIVDAGIRAPSGGNAQLWRFLTVSDPETIGRLAPLYRQGIETLFSTVYANAASATSTDRGAATVARVQSSAEHLAEHFHEVPLLIFAFAQGGERAGSSIYPAMWSMCLAARAHGIGSTFTTILAMHLKETLEILGVPADSGYDMMGCLPMGYPTGNWGVAERKPAHKVTYAEQWGQAPAWSASEPLWPGS